MKLLVKIVLGLSLPLLLMRCSESGNDVQPQGINDEIVAAMTDAIQDEYRAQLFYQKTLNNLGNVLPFANIVNAENRHAESLANLFVKYGLTVPQSQWKDEEITAFPTLAASCANCYQAEIDNIALYDSYLSLDLPDDVRRVFENNRSASLNMHLPAFSACK